MLSINKYAGSNCFKTNNIKRKTKLLSRPGETCQNWETPIGTGKVDWSDEISCLSDHEKILQKFHLTTYISI